MEYPLRETSGQATDSEVSATRLRKTHLIVGRLVLIPVFLAGCSRSEAVSDQAPYYAGTFQAICSPVDAPGFLFDFYRLGDPEPPLVSISTWQFEYPVEGSQIDLRGRGGYGAAFIGGTEWIPAADGAIGFENLVRGEIAKGWFWLVLDGIDRIEGRFEATWSDEGPARCG